MLTLLTPAYRACESNWEVGPSIDMYLLVHSAMLTLEKSTGT